MDRCNHPSAPSKEWSTGRAVVPLRTIEFVSLAILRRARSRSKPKVPNRAVEKAFHTHILVRLRLNPWLKMLWGERRG